MAPGESSDLPKGLQKVLLLGFHSFFPSDHSELPVTEGMPVEADCLAVMSITQTTCRAVNKFCLSLSSL